MSNTRVTRVRYGHVFYFSPKYMPATSQDHAIFIKYGMTEFSSFPTREQYHRWFLEYKSYCEENNTAFKIFELIVDGRPTAFYADIEGYSPIDACKDELLMIRHNVKDAFRNQYALLDGDADDLIWMEDHRESDGKQKTSFHVIGRDKKFLDVKGGGAMRKFADKLEPMVTAEVLAMGMNIDFWSKALKRYSVLDMCVYHSQRAVRTLSSSKYANARGFVLCEECKYRDFRECFINLDIPPEELHKHHFITADPASPTATRATPPAPSPKVRRVVHQDATPEHEATMRRIEHILTTVYNHRLTGIKFTGLYMNMDQYRIDGVRDCPVCAAVHDSNGAYIRDLQNGQFLYKCLTPGPNNTEAVCISTDHEIEQANPSEPVYLQSLQGIIAKCVAACAGMGVGKTHQIVGCIESELEGLSVLWLTPRIAMVASIMGRLEGLGFQSYKDTCKSRRLVMEIESLHKVFMQYDCIVMDEARSLMNSLMSYETNGDKLLAHIKDLKEMCQSAKRVFIVGADINIDGAVPAFIKDVFEEDQVFRINHAHNPMVWHHLFMHSEVFYERLYRSIAEGERIIVACGESIDLKEIQVAASRIIERKKMVAAHPNAPAHDLEVAVSMIETSDEVGAYHAECEIKSELEDVNTHWDKYQAILFTSTITVSVDYQGSIDRVFSLPSRTTANDREFDQMHGRGRKNKSKEIIVRYDGEHIAPRKNDDKKLFGGQMSLILTRRKYVENTMHGYEREIYNSIEKKGFGYQAKYSPTLATELHVWAKVEEYKKIHDWFGSYLARLKTKGHTWEFTALKPTEPVKTPIDVEINALVATRKDMRRKEKDRVQGAKKKREEIKNFLEERKKARASLKEEKDALERELAACRQRTKQKREEIKALPLGEREKVRASLKEEKDALERELEACRQRAKKEREETKPLALEARKKARASLKEDKDALERELVACRTQLTQKKDERKQAEAERPNTYTEEAKKRKDEIRRGEVQALGGVDTLQETDGSIETRKKRKYDCAATANDHLVLKKNDAQRYFADALSGEEVVFFIKNKRAIFNRMLYNKYPLTVRHKLHANNIEMSIADDYANMDIKLLDLIDTVVSELGLESVTDTSPFDWQAMVSSDKAGGVTAALDKMDEARGVEHSCSSDLARMRHYFKAVLGYKILARLTRTMHDGTTTVHTSYYMADALSGILEKPNTIADEEWLADHCDRYNRHRRTLSYRHDEAAFMREQMEKTEEPSMRETNGASESITSYIDYQKYPKPSMLSCEDWLNEQG